MFKTIRSLLLTSVLIGSMVWSTPLLLAHAEPYKEKMIEENEDNKVQEPKDIFPYPCERKLTEEQKRLLKQKKAELKEKYLANLEQMDEEQKKAALSKYKEELLIYMEKELGLKFKRKHKDNAMQP